MEEPKGGFVTHLCNSIIFIPVFASLFVIGIIKGAIFSPFVFLVIAFGVIGILIGLWPCHLAWTIYCTVRTKKFGPKLKCLLILSVPIPIALWTVVGVLGSLIMGIGYGFVWPIMETFRAVNKKGVPISEKLARCFLDGTWSNVWGACTIVRDFADFSYHSYFSVMNDLLESEEQNPIELKISKIPGSILCEILGVLVDVPVISVISLYKAPVLLFKGWQRLVQDLVGREGPFLETVCVPFAGFSILLWPAVVLLVTASGIISSFFIGCYAAVVAYQESSVKRGLLYVIASVALFDEYTNDLLYLREGSCFPRPKYRKKTGNHNDVASSFLPVEGLKKQLDVARGREAPMRSSSMTVRTLNAAVIWDNLFKACQHVGKELLKAGAIGKQDLEGWQHTKIKIVSVGIPAYVFLECFFRSIKNDSPGFLMRNNVELTSLNRPEGRVFDWLFEPMSVMKDQLKNLNLVELEELYLYKYCLFSGDKTRIEAWQNGGFPPEDEIRRAQLEGMGRRLHGFCLTLSRMPMSRRRFFEVAREIQQEERKESYVPNASDDLGDAV